MNGAAAIDRRIALPTTGWAEAERAPRTTIVQFADADRAPGWPVLAVAGVLSVALHLAALAAFAPRQAVAIEGGAPPALAALGHAFEDFAQGAQPVTPAAAPAVPPPLAPAAAPRQHALPARPAFADPAALALPDSALPEAPAARPNSRQAVLPPAWPAATDVARPPTTIARDDPAVTVTQAAPDTPRPPRRPDPTARTRVQTPAQPAGNATQEARRGAASGQEAAPAARSGAAAAPAAASGDAAASNYPGEVLRQLHNTRRSRVSGRGVAVVVFAIADSGALASVTIAAPSGSATLDEAARDHIRRAAPFPPPPAGAQRRFRFEFASR